MIQSFVFAFEDHPDFFFPLVVFLLWDRVTPAVDERGLLPGFLGKDMHVDFF